MKEIDLSLFRKSGEGANGESFDSITDPNLMLKLYFDFYDKEAIITELDVCQKVYNLGIPTPEPGILVTAEGRMGILFKRVIGKRSYARALADEPERTEEFSREFARACRELHRFECKENIFPDAKGQFFHLLDASKECSPEEKVVFREFIQNLPDCDNVLHGDMHIGNVLTTLPKGAPLSDPHDIYFIDLGYFSKGYSYIDLGMIMMICNYALDEFVFHDMHIHVDQAARVWKIFVQEYFADMFASGEVSSVDDVNLMLLPYAAMKMLLVEYNLGFMPVDYVSVFHKAIIEMKNTLDRKE